MSGTATSALIKPGQLLSPDDEGLSPREFIEFAINLKGRPISLDWWPWIHRILDQPFLPTTKSAENGDYQAYRRKMLLVFGRQSAKSTSLANLDIALCNLIPYLRVLYITASDPQMREFSDERLRAVIQDSPHLMMLSGQLPGAKKEVQNVQTRRWINQSKIILRSVFDSADRARGISADVLNVDELQDVLSDHLPVIEETLFASELVGGPISIYSGTPKTFDNTLEFLWGRFSTQNEWVVRCDRCGHWNVIEYENVGPHGLICTRKGTGGTCAGPLNPVFGKSQWVRFGNANAEWEGFRVPQPVTIYTTRDPARFRERWQLLQDKISRYPVPKLMNEVFARSYDQGVKPITLQQVRACCNPDLQMFTDPPRAWQQGNSWAGVDWGSGGISKTVFSIWRYNGTRTFTCVFAKAFSGFEADPEYVLEEIVRLCTLWNVNRIGSDFGYGAWANSHLMKKLGAAKVVLYMHSMTKAKVKLDREGGKFVTHRTRVLQDCFDLIKKGPGNNGVMFPRWEEFESFSRDLLSVFSSETHRKELVYDHPPDSPDDFLHSFCYALLVSQLDIRRPDLMSPDKKTDY